MKTSVAFFASEGELSGFVFLLWLYHELVVVGYCNWEAKKANLLKITGEDDFKYYTLMVLSNCFAGRFVNDSCALTACCPPPSQEEMVANTQ